MSKSTGCAIFFLLIFISFKSFSQNPQVVGQWSTPISFDLVPVAVANLPDGRLLTWSSKYHDNFGGDDGFTFTQIFDPNMGIDGGVLPRTRTDTNHDMFCPGINNMPDGRILATGGSSSERASIYDPRTEKWTRADDMLVARGYQGAVTLSDGSSFTIGGSWSGGAYGGRTAEVYSDATGWRLLSGLPGELLWNAEDNSGEPEGQFRMDNHAWLWAAPNGKIFQAGPGETMHWLDVTGDGSSTVIGQRGDDKYSMNGNTAMFDIGKLLKVGGSRSYGSGTISNEKAYVIDINDENNVTVTRTANNMQHARIFVSSVVLPTGEVLVLGGMNTSVPFSDVGAHLSAEIFNPDTNSFRTVASMQVPRTYHSTGILLMDGRVFMGGGGLCGNCPAGGANHPNAEIYSPPYLFNTSGDLAVRPTLSAPDNAYFERAFSVLATPGIAEFSFIRMSSATHSVNNEQRRVPVTFTESNGSYQLDMPNANLMPPGYYMLFAIDASGVPSISKAVLVGSSDSIIQEDNLIVEFDFFEGSGSYVTDTSGKNNNGEIKEHDNAGNVIPLSTDYWNAEGFSGSALQMDGMEFNSNSILEIPTSPTLAALTNQITVMAWVNRNTGSIIPQNGAIPNVAIFAHDYGSFFFGYHNSLYKLEFFTDNGGQASCYTGEYNPGEWEHLVGTYDGTIAKLYVNGQQICSSPVTGNLQINTTDPLYNTFTLSGFYDKRPAPVVPYGNSSGITDELDGSLDKFKLYNVALTEQEIRVIYNKEKGIVIDDRSCENLTIVYEVNGVSGSGDSEITVNVGDDVELSLSSEAVDFTLRGPDGSILTSNMITDITIPQAGLYSIYSDNGVLPQAQDPVLIYVDSEELVDEYAPATNALDGNPNTFWHTEWSPSGVGEPGYPHEIQLDLGENAVLTGFTYLPRQTGVNGRIGGYDIYISNSTSDYGSVPIASGTWANDAILKTVNFPATQARYLRFVATSPATTGQPWASAAEIGVLRPVPTVIYVDSQELTASQSGRGSNAVDGNPNTIWHTEWNTVTRQYPHEIQIDLGEETQVMGLDYLPRQDATLNGTIANYEIYVSNSTSSWGPSVASGTWAYNHNLKRVNFTEKQGRYIRLVALSEGGGNAWASAAEIKGLTSTNQCIKTIQINVEDPITYTYNEGWLPSDPNGVARIIDTIIVDEGATEISSNTSCKNLIIEPGTTLTVNTGVTLDAVSTTLNSTSVLYSSLIVEGQINGEVNYKRFVNVRGTSSGGGNDLVSSPVENANFNNSFVLTNTNLPQNPNNFGEFAFAPYNVVAGAYQNFNIGIYRLDEFPIVSGVGYRAATTTGSTLTFTGSTSKTNVDVPISDAVAGRAWNLVGNPYPSYMDVQEFFTINNIDQFHDQYVAIYGYTGNRNSWNTYNLATSATLMAPGQGFFVKAQEGGGTLQFTPQMRRSGSSDDFILGRQENINRALSQLKLSNNEDTVTTSIYFIEGTTRGLDPGYDAAVYSATAVDFSLFTNLLENNIGLGMAIQSLPYNDFNDVVVPLGVKAIAGVELTISIDDLSTIPANIKVYLEDIQNNTLTLLNNNDFRFTPTVNINSADLFNVHYSSATLTVDDMQSIDNLRIFTTVNPKTLFINGRLNKATSANLYDIQGRLVLSKVLNPNITKNTMDISSISTGVYVVKVNTDNQVKTQKVIIK